jgi:hypothetical protein
MQERRKKRREKKYPEGTVKIKYILEFATNTHKIIERES